MMKPSERLLAILAGAPDLEFRNKGYQNLHRDVIESRASEIAAVEGILRGIVWDFVRFQNFRFNQRSQKMQVRYQVRYSPHFTGVAYTDLETIDAWAEGGTEQ